MVIINSIKLTKLTIKAIQALLDTVLVIVCLLLRDKHDHGNSHINHLVGVCFQFQWFSPLSSWQEAWRGAGSHGAGGAESSASRLAGSRKRLWAWDEFFETSKSTPNGSDYLQ